MDALLLTAPDGRILAANPEACRMLQRSEKEICQIGRNGVVDLNDPKLPVALEERARTGQFKGELNLKRKDGSIFPAEVSTNVFKTRDGRETTSMIIRDITERKRMEELLRASELKYRLLFEKIPHPIYQTSPEGKLLSVNPAFKNLFGYESDTELATLNVEHDFYVNSEDRRKWMKDIEANDEVRDVELVLRRRNGERVTVLNTAHAVRDERGVILRYEGTLTDITDRRRMEDEIKRYSKHLEELVEERTGALRESEKKYRQLIETAQEGVFTYDTNTVVTFVNPYMSTLLGYTLDEIVGKSLLLFFDEGTVNSVKEGVERRRQGVGETLTGRLVRKDGKRIIVSATTSPIVSEDGKFAGALVLLTDITKREEMEQRLHQAQRLATIGELAAMVGHDLRNPMQGITAATYILRNNSLSKEERDETLQMIDDSVEHSNKIVSDLLDYSREIHLTLANTTPREITASALEAVKIPNTIRVQNQFQEQLMLTVDSERIRRVFINLLTNAVEAMPNGGDLIISSKESNGFVEIAISDTGTGLEKRIQENLWKPLQTTKTKGMGLGLPICKRIIDAHGGQIAVESKQGKGTTFTIRLPIKPKP
jgi:PAS domain S-box-containing protein